MEKEMFNFLLEIPATLSKFGNWLITPLDSTYLPISPLGLLGVGGVTFIVALIAIHIVRLFV